MGFLQRRSFRFGVPFLVMIVGGSFGLQKFTELRYEYRSRKRVSKEEADAYGVKMKDPKEVTLDSEFEKMEKIDYDTWEQVRGPRPWEADNKLYEEAKQRAANINRT
ncbi:unnamed protein product [Meganyctiphanes norvegica]|uniref:Cytochrome c oxidase assembly protein COX16 homolog, mitochondrial n=1 Tax=Meganyctiphanes norvegica TaxID=48144 RepID=A0AAV2Q936_MEGNR